MERNRKSSSKKDNEEKKSNKKIIITAFLIITAISSSFITFFILQVALNTTHPVVVVISGSMEPNIYENDLLFVQGIDAADIRNGTVEDQDGHVIVFIARWLAPEEQGTPVVHRVVNKTYDDEDGKWKFQTKGDNVLTNPVKDAGGFWTSEDDILGIVIGKIPYVGWIFRILGSSPIITYFLIGIIILLIISIVWDMTKEKMEEE